MTSPKLLAVGGAHVDRRGQMTDVFVPGASIPGTMREDVGGGAFNALRTAVQRVLNALDPQEAPAAVAGERTAVPILVGYS